MASSLDPNNFPDQGRKRVPSGHDSRSLGPSDSSDSGSDLIGPGLKEDEDDALSLDQLPDEDARAEVEEEDTGEDADVDLDDDDSDRPGTRRHAADRVVEVEEADPGGGLDQAEEARAELVDEKIEEEGDDR